MQRGMALYPAARVCGLRRAAARYAGWERGPAIILEHNQIKADLVPVLKAGPVT